jgi:rod shape determining protein RodA
MASLASSFVRSLILRLSRVDWVLLIALIPLIGGGLASLYVFGGENTFFYKQLVWFLVGGCVYVVLSSLDLRFLRRSSVVLSVYLILSFFLLLLFLVGSMFQGARSWFDLGSFAVQPADPMKLALILVLAKYFSRRHIEIAHTKHILISGMYAFLPFVLVLVQPDFGSAIIILAIWFGMTILAGISMRHLLLILGGGVLAFALLWVFVFQPYQKARIMTFVHPLADVRGAGYNAHQSAIAVGSGQVWGKGIGYGTQSRLNFLPEHETDFVFASFAEEWGFAGILMILLAFGVIFYRISVAATVGASNFETLYALGFGIFLLTQFVIHVGMNMSLLPVTGQTLPFMSYGGSHIVTEFAGLGLLMGMRRYARDTHRGNIRNEFLGI